MIKKVTNEGGRPSLRAPEPSQPSHKNLEDSSNNTNATMKEGQEKIPDSIYRAYGDTWKCKNNNCNVKGDKWYMIKHPQHCRAK